MLYSGEDCDVERLDPKKTDPEYFEYECLTVEEVEKLLNESVEKLNTILQITPSLAKVLLLEHQWINQVVVDKYRQNANTLLVETRIKPPCNNTDPSLELENMPTTSAAAANASASASSSLTSSPAITPAVVVVGTLSTYSKSPTTTPTLNSSSSSLSQYRSQMCPVCATVQLGDKFYSLSCGHSFCKDCWCMYFETQIFLVC